MEIEAYWVSEETYKELAGVWSSQRVGIDAVGRPDESNEELILRLEELLFAEEWISEDDLVVFEESSGPWLILGGKSDRIFSEQFARYVSSILQVIDPESRYIVMVNFEQEDTREKIVPDFIMKSGMVYIIYPAIDSSLDEEMRDFIATLRCNKEECTQLWFSQRTGVRKGIRARVE